MFDITTQVDGGATSFPAVQFNNLVACLENLVTSAGITLDGSKDDQIRKAISTYSRGLFCADTGSPNAYVVARPNSSLVDCEAYYDGLCVLFKANNTNTGSSTVNFNGLGIKNIVNNNNVLSSGEIQKDSYNILFFNATNDNFELLSIVNQKHVQNFTLIDSTSGLNLTLSNGDTYNLLTNILESNETKYDNYYPTFIDVNDNIRSTYLDETNNKFLFPENNRTFSKNKINYLIRLKLTFNHNNIGGGNLLEFTPSIKRVIDNSVVYTFQKTSFKDVGATTGRVYTDLASTFVAGETDPYVVDGMYLSLDISPSSNVDMVLTSVQIKIDKI